MRWIQAVCVLAVAISLQVTSLQAQGVLGSPGLNPDSKDQILRRRDRVEELGTIQATPQGFATEALGPPPSDDHKFDITVITCAAPQWVDASNQLLHDINTSEQFSAWIKKDDPEHSWARYQVRRIEDVTQEWWFKGVKDRLQPRDAAGKAIIPVDANGKQIPLFPAIVIQPPLKDRAVRKRVVAVLQGYDGNAEHTCELIGRAIDEWNIARALEPGAVPGGHGLVDAPVFHGAPAPFPTPPTAVDPFEPTNSQVTFPERLKKLNEPPAPKPLSVKQIQDLCPGAPAFFVRDQHKAKVTDPDAVSLDWLAYQEEQALKAKLETKPAVKPAAVVEHDDSAYDSSAAVMHRNTVGPDMHTDEAKSDDANFPEPDQAWSGPDFQTVMVWIALIVLLAPKVIAWFGKTRGSSSSGTSSTFGPTGGRTPSNTVVNTPGGNVGDWPRS